MNNADDTAPMTEEEVDAALDQLVTFAKRNPKEQLTLCPRCLSFASIGSGFLGAFDNMYGCQFCGWRGPVPLEVTLEDLLKVPEEQLRKAVRNWKQKPS